jgi:hypothetical protein
MAAYIGAQLDVKNTHWQKAYGSKAGTLGQHYGGKVLSGARATSERLDSVIATLPPLLEQRIAAECQLDSQGQGTARHGSASVRTGTQTMPASATNHTRGATPAHARMPSCAECERGMDLHTTAGQREARAAHARDAVSGSEEAELWG